MTDPVNDAGNEVVFDGVSKSFGQTQVLRDLDLRIGAGELVAVLGPSGCGKTTALRILAGFERPTSGRVLVDGRDLTTVPANKRGVGMVFQAYSLFPNLSVQDNVEYGPRVRRASGSERERRAVELLEMCELGHLRDRYPHELSGGQQQRVALARALAVEPRVLLLDEPLSALDAIVRTQIREEIRRLQRQLGITTMFVTHDQEEALSVADRVAVLKDGLIEQIDEPQTVYSKPRTHFVATFVGSITELGVDSTFVGGELVPARPGEGLDSIFVRPEDLVLSPSESGSHVVTAQTFTGERTVVRATVEGDRPDVVSSVTAAQAAALPVGSRVAVSVTTQPALRIPAAEVPRSQSSKAQSSSTVDA